jgi:amidase
MSDVLLQSATALATRLRRRELSSREATELMLAHIDATNPGVNAVVKLRSG